MTANPQTSKTNLSRPSRPTELLREFIDVSRDFQKRIEDITAVNPTDRLVMERLLDGGPQSPSALARAVGITPAAMTTSLDRLEALGHATRAADSTDRRKVVVTATPESTRVIMATVMSMVDDLEALGNQFTEEEMETVTRFLERAVEVYARHSD